MKNSIQPGALATTAQRGKCKDKPTNPRSLSSRHRTTRRNRRIAFFHDPLQIVYYNCRAALKPGILSYRIIYCTLFPEVARCFALKSRIFTTVGKRDMPVHALKSRTNFGLNFVRLLNAEFRDFSAENLCTQIPETDENKGTQFQDLSAARQRV